MTDISAACIIYLQIKQCDWHRMVTKYDGKLNLDGAPEWSGDSIGREVWIKMRLTLEEIREKSVPIAQRYGVKRLGLFGSYARGEETDQSDLDFLISKGKLSGLFQYMEFVLELEDTFGCHVDVVTDGIEDKEFIRHIKQDEVLLYEAS